MYHHLYLHLMILKTRIYKNLLINVKVKICNKINLHFSKVNQKSQMFNNSL